MLSQIKEIFPKNNKTGDRYNRLDTKCRKLADFIWSKVDSIVSTKIDKKWEFKKGDITYILWAIGKVDDWKLFIDDREVMSMHQDTWFGCNEELVDFILE